MTGRTQQQLLLSRLARFNSWTLRVQDDDAEVRHYWRARYTAVDGWWTSRWFQPLWKILVKLGSSSPNRDENKKYLKPPPSGWCDPNSSSLRIIWHLEWKGGFEPVWRRGWVLKMTPGLWGVRILRFKKNLMKLSVSGWWFQPIWKILVKLDHSPR